MTFPSIGGGRVGLAHALALVAGISGCRPGECSQGEARCEGSAAQICQINEDGNGGRFGLWIDVADCAGQVCTVAPGRAGQAQAFCALSNRPDARCADTDLPVCDGTVLVSCTGGYATAETHCATGCLGLDDHADGCAEAPPGDPLCQFDGSGCEVSSVSGTAICGAVPGPGGACTAGGCAASTPTSTQAYSFRCEHHALTARTRCPAGCAVAADCTTHCL
jgi:hypothetical protein